MSARWEDALDAQLDLYLFSTSERGQRYMLGWSTSQTEADHEQGLQPGGLWYRTADRVAALAFNADTFAVEPDMQTLWEAAVPGFEPEPLQPTDLLTDSGFLYLPRPYTLTDRHGWHTTFRALLWRRMEWTSVDLEGREHPASGIVLYLFHRVGDPDDYDRDDDEGTVNRPRPVSEAFQSALRSGLLRTGDLLVDFVMPWEFGLDYVGLRTGSAGTSVPQPVQALWRLLAQHIVTRTNTRAPRSVRRRLQKAKMPERDIVVVRLRRPSARPDPDREPRAVEWTHRWLVSGHWRQQWFPSLSMHRQIWISAFVKGPEDKPLEVRKARVFDWAR